MLVKYFFELFFEALSNFLSRTRLCCFVSFAATLIFYQSLSGLSSTFFTFFWFRPRIVFRDSSTTCFCVFWRTSVFYRICHLLSSTFFKKFVERRKRDLNPRAAVNDLLPFQGSPFGQLGYFSTVARIAFYYYIITWYSHAMNGEGGIRTHVPLRTNGFQDRLVMTTSIPLQCNQRN